MTLTLDKQNAYRDKYHRRRPTWQPAAKVYEATIRELLHPTMRVLDLGCGRGGALEQIGGLIDFAVGLDPDPTSLREHRLPDLPRAVAHSDAVPLHNESMDMILCSWVFEHLADPAHTFAEIRRVLRPGGCAVFLTPNATSLVARLNRVLRPFQRLLVKRLYGREEADTFPIAYRANTPARISALARDNGLNVERLRQIEDPTYLAFSSIMFEVSIILSRVTPPVHLVGVLVR
jgi:SAM-dependent methyltransferase